jgi:hypothetical protein
MVKYSPSGAELWVSRNTDAEDVMSRPHALAIDKWANIYVTGHCFTPSSETDYATIKYDGKGERKWNIRYDGPQHTNDYPTAFAIDAMGNAYTTGWSECSGKANGFLTVKNNSAGSVDWAARYDSPGKKTDEAAAIAVDARGNVYVAGRTVLTNANADITTVKYNSSGAEEWVALYDGPGNGIDEATAITVDDIGNLYVTGYSRGSGTLGDYITLKYDATGVMQWVARYNGPGNNMDVATAIAMDSLGNVYVTGGSLGSSGMFEYATIKYSPSGEVKWISRSDCGIVASCIAVDDIGNVYVTGHGGNDPISGDYGTVKYDSSGAEEWVALYDGPGNGIDEATAITVDDIGNLYVTGYSRGSGTLDDYTTLKYDATGVMRWVARYDGPVDGWDEATAIAVDGSGSIYVTGRSEGTGYQFDYATVKYDASGQEAWVETYNGPAGADDKAIGIAVDPEGRVYVTGYTSFAGGREYTTIRYDQTAPKYAYRERWNLVSLPREVADPSRSAVFPFSVSTLYEYGNGYTQPDSLEIGKGYWLRFTGPGCVSIEGDTVLVDTVNIAAGWNLIGSITRPVAWFDVISDPPGMIVSPLLGFDGQYFPSDTIFPGKAYWVSASQSGKLILSASSVPSSVSARIRIVPAGGAPPPAPDEQTADTPASSVPENFALRQNYPNPFNPATVLEYSLPVDSYVSLRVFDVLGREVALLVNGMVPAGEKSAEWDASGAAGGIYFCRLDATDATRPAKTFTQTRKMLLIR